MIIKRVWLHSLESFRSDNKMHYGFRREDKWKAPHTYTHNKLLNKRSIKIMNFFLLLLPFIIIVVVALIHVPSGSRKKMNFIVRDRTAQTRKISAREKRENNFARAFQPHAVVPLRKQFPNFKHRLQHSILQFILSVGLLRLIRSWPSTGLAAGLWCNVESMEAFMVRLISAPDTLKWSWRFRVFLISFFVVLSLFAASFKGSRAPKNAIFFAFRLVFCLLIPR